MKTCPDCGEHKSLEEFPVAAKRSDGRATYCKACMLVRSRASYRKRAAAKGKQVREAVATPPDYKRCPDCGEIKPLEAFPRNKNSKNGRATHCKPCHNARSEETRQRLYGGGRHYHLMRRYGLTEVEVDEMLLDQGDLCALCREAPAQHVDHDHKTGEVRGILCFNCNGGLGQFRDRVDILLNAVAYLERGKTWQRVFIRTDIFQLRSRDTAAASATSSERPPPSS